MPPTITPTSLAIHISRTIIFGEILDTQPDLCHLLRQAIFRAARQVIADQITDGDAAAPLSTNSFPSTQRTKTQLRLHQK